MKITINIIASLIMTNAFATGGFSGEAIADPEMAKIYDMKHMAEKSATYDEIELKELHTLEPNMHLRITNFV